MCSSSTNYHSINSSVSEDTHEKLVYTELLRGSVPCPTCWGVGSIPKVQEGQLVAMIPMKDKRLKPRQTHIWVCLAVFLCLTIAGLLMFFLCPRNVKMTSDRPYLNPVGPVYLNVLEQYVSFYIVNVNISNDNYFPVKITGVDMMVLYDTQVISQTTNISIITVPLRSHVEHYVTINITLSQINQFGYMVNNCLMPIRWVHELVMLFQFACYYEFLGHQEQTTLQTFQFVSCYSNNKTATVMPKLISTSKTPTLVTE